MAHQSTRSSRIAGLVLLVFAVAVLSGCGGTEPEWDDVPGAGTPIVLLEAPSPTAVPDRVPPTAAPTLDPLPTVTSAPAPATPAPVTVEIRPPESPEEVFAVLEQVLASQDGIYHARLEQVVEGWPDPTVTPRWSGDLWLDVGNGVGRAELRPDPDAREDIGWLWPNAVPLASRAIFHADDVYLAMQDVQIWRSVAAPCPSMEHFTLVAYLLCRSAVSPWADGIASEGHSPMSLDLEAQFKGKPALSFTYGGWTSTILYLDPDTFLPIAWTMDMMESGALVTTIASEVIDRSTIDAGFFDPVSIGYVAAPAPAGKIAFWADQDHEPAIFTINADGTGEQNLTDRRGLDIHSAWSPDGSKIAFMSERDGNREVYVMNADGSGPTNLTNNPAPDGGGVWSPDGGKLLFWSDRDGTNMAELYVMNADGSNVYRLSPQDGVQHAAWSHDGTRIAFSGEGLYVINVDGTGEARLTEGLGGFWPQWLPGDDRIVFAGSTESGEDIFAVNADGSGLTNLTDSPFYEGSPSLSPDGTRIVFSTDRDNPQCCTDIYIMNADGSGQERLVYPAGVGSCDTGCAWSPDSMYVAFSIDPFVGADRASFGEERESRGGIYLVSADGGIVTRLTATAGYDLAWSP